MSDLLKKTSNLLIRSFIMSDLSNSLIVAHLSWAIWAICSQSLIWSERYERIPNPGFQNITSQVITKPPNTPFKKATFYVQRLGGGGDTHLQIVYNVTNTTFFCQSSLMLFYAAVCLYNYCWAKLNPEYPGDGIAIITVRTSDLLLEYKTCQDFLVYFSYYFDIL